MRRHHGDGELHRQGQQAPNAVAPGEHRLLRVGSGAEDGEGQRDRGEDHADHPRVGHEALGEARQARANVAKGVQDHGPLSELRKLVRQGEGAEVTEEDERADERDIPPIRGR